MPAPAIPPPPGDDRLRIFSPDASKVALPSGFLRIPIIRGERKDILMVCTDEAWAKLPDAARPEDAKLVEGGAAWFASSTCP